MKPALSTRQRETLVRILQPFASRIERVIVFGSRATGKNSDASDIDLAIDGDVSQSDLWRLYTLFDECSLAVRVDVVDYRRVRGTAIGRHIDAVGLPLEGVGRAARAAVVAGIASA